MMCSNSTAALRCKLAGKVALTRRCEARVRRVKVTYSIGRAEVKDSKSESESESAEAT